MSLIFYDFEVFKHNWLVVFIDPIKREQTIIIDDRDKFTEFYENHKGDIWVGYNSGNYDQYIAKGILCGFNPYDVSEWIISKDRKGWQFSYLFRQFPILDFDVSTGFHSLKQLEAFMGNDIRETSVPFDIDRPLTVEEIQETVKYCIHDVEQTIQVFTHRYEMFESQMGLIKAFKLPLSCVSKSQSQLAGIILGATRSNYTDEFDVLIPPTLSLSEKYRHVIDFFTNNKVETYAEMQAETERLLSLKDSMSADKFNAAICKADPKNPESFRKWFYSRRIEVDVAGVPHVFAWGGVHGAIPQYVEEGRFVMADVASLYPSLMIRYNYFSRSITDPQKYVQIYETNLEMKKTKDPQRPAYKLVCNKTYGALKDVNNPLYDPQMANNICIAGQLLLLDLIEKLEGVCKLIQSNTDGILVKVDSDEDYQRFESIVHAWEERTGLTMEFSEFERVIQKDVNGYLIISSNGKCKRIGSYVKPLKEIDNDLPIVNRAIVEYLTNGIHPAVTVETSDNLRDFQKVVKVSSKYSHASHNGERLQGKTFRVFASLREEDGNIGKCKGEGKTIEKFANTPEKCFIHNGEVSGVNCPPYLDKNYYVDLAIKRINDFGVKVL